MTRIFGLLDKAGLFLSKSGHDAQSNTDPLRGWKSRCSGKPEQVSFGYGTVVVSLHTPRRAS